MYLIVSMDIKFKTNQEKIERRINHFGLRKIQNTLYIGELDKIEQNLLVKSINEIIKENDSVLITPICQNCYSKKETCGREIKFKNDLFRVY
ncbi:CRISPR-associated protein, Cas2 family [Methanobrevibacter gottschalkii]|uniref:CRISPR-associated endoribonuclease Cas2 n=1 Tax=Methanobrevibacter gottschalkii TaxID=190974 RepID=A0A1H7NI84_9EURY|nr:CRISPR-associated endonuclease Cas2 [Methanobrevibacter gottschalkii]SEL22617.1 CRISPR-associated protein, Cas2 family [Methanobrevibacter gottschalkii]